MKKKLLRISHETEKNIYRKFASFCIQLEFDCRTLYELHVAMNTNQDKYKISPLPYGAFYGNIVSYI